MVTSFMLERKEALPSIPFRIVVEALASDDGAIDPSLRLRVDPVRPYIIEIYRDGTVLPIAWIDVAGGTVVWAEDAENTGTDKTSIDLDRASEQSNELPPAPAEADEEH